MSSYNCSIQDKVSRVLNQHPLTTEAHKSTIWAVREIHTSQGRSSDFIPAWQTLTELWSLSGFGLSLFGFQQIRGSLSILHYINVYYFHLFHLFLGSGTFSPPAMKPVQGFLLVHCNHGSPLYGLSNHTSQSLIGDRLSQDKVSRELEPTTSHSRGPYSTRWALG